MKVCQMTMQKPIVKSKDTPDLGVFSWSDPFHLEQQLSEEERMHQALRCYSWRGA